MHLAFLIPRLVQHDRHTIMLNDEQNPAAAWQQGFDAADGFYRNPFTSMQPEQMIAYRSGYLFGRRRRRQRRQA